VIRSFGASYQNPVSAGFCFSTRHSSLQGDAGEGAVPRNGVVEGDLAEGDAGPLEDDQGDLLVLSPAAAGAGARQDDVGEGDAGQAGGRPGRRGPSRGATRATRPASTGMRRSSRWHRATAGWIEVY
jgi:hypothetical protein